MKVQFVPFGHCYPPQFKLRHYRTNAVGDRTYRVGPRFEARRDQRRIGTKGFPERRASASKTGYDAAAGLNVSARPFMQ
jgi:hypothetical protein